MKIHYAIPGDDLYRALRAAHPLVVAIGFFDGFHRGHRAIVRALLEERRPGERAAVITFRNHPSSLLRPGTEPPLITTLDERVNNLANAGIDEAFVLTFDHQIASLSPNEFIDTMLVDRIGARAMVVGENFRFGARRAGDIGFARSQIELRGGTLVAVPNAMDAGERVSSTRVRAALADGNGELADRLLGAPYTVRGLVTFGAGRGHDLGFPTANIAVPAEKMVPPDGVYQIVGRHDGRDYRGLVSIGTNPTFDGRERTVEAWLLDFNGSLYGHELALRDFRFLRGQVKFDSVEALLAQIQADAQSVHFPSFV